MNKHITDLTEQEVREFIKDLGDELIECKFNKKTDEIKCKVSFKYFSSFENKTSKEGYLSLILSNPYYWDNGEESLYYQYGEEALENWKQFCFAKGIYPDWVFNNPYTKTHVLQLTDEQINLSRAALCSMCDVFVMFNYDEDAKKTMDILKYLRQFVDKK